MRSANQHQNRDHMVLESGGIADKPESTHVSYMWLDMRILILQVGWT